MNSMPSRGTPVTQNGHKHSKDDGHINDVLAFEQIRVLITRLHHAQREHPVRVLAVTSSTPGEGKTTIAANIALVASKFFEQKTLLVDADFRRPNIAGLLKASFSHGLSEVLRGTVQPVAARWQLLDKPFTVLPLVKPDPSSIPLLSNPAARARFQEAIEGFDLVVIDTPPTLPLADNYLISDLVDGFIFVVKAEETPRQLIKSAIKSIPRNKLLGFVLNQTRMFGSAAYGHFYYRPMY